MAVFSPAGSLCSGERRGQVVLSKTRSLRHVHVTLGLRHPWLRTVLEAVARPRHPTSRLGRFQHGVWASVRGMAFRNRAEPWMAEPSVHGRIHSVFRKAIPLTLACTSAEKSDSRNGGKPEHFNPGL